jgi:hypothetical protein
MNRLRGLALILIGFFLLTQINLLRVNAQDDTPKVVEYIVSATTANLRGGAGTSFGKVAALKKGDSVLVYDETPETKGWLRVYRKGDKDAYIADYLIERAPQRFYPADQEPVFVVKGKGKTVSDVYEIPRGAYRIDAVIQDNAFILKSTVVEGDCNDDIIFNQFAIGNNKLEMSGLLVSQGCSIIFETDNVNSAWEFAVRDLLDLNVLSQSILNIEKGTKINGKGHVLTMPTQITEGVWKIQVVVKDQAFILTPQVLTGDCDTSSVFNEIDMDNKQIDASAIYRVPKDGCLIYWQTDNVDKEWELTFDKVK